MTKKRKSPFRVGKNQPGPYTIGPGCFNLKTLPLVQNNQEKTANLIRKATPLTVYGAPTLAIRPYGSRRSVSCGPSGSVLAIAHCHCCRMTRSSGSGSVLTMSMNNSCHNHRVRDLSNCRGTTASTRTGNSAALHCQPVMRSVLHKRYISLEHPIMV